jgi:hypothetical protein
MIFEAVLHKVRKAHQILRQKRGAYHFARTLYRGYLRPLLPVTGHVRYNGVKVDIALKLFDRVLPKEFSGVDNIRDYEDAIVSSILAHVRRGDVIVVVGAGWGVSTVVAAQTTGEHGSVICYEGSEEFYNRTKRAVELNRVADRVTVHHEVVSHARHLFGWGAATRHVKPAELPRCDILELDCEGAEAQILKSIQVRPRIVIVETHGLYGSCTEDVLRILENSSYEILSVQVAESRVEDFCKLNDIHVIVAREKSRSESF